MAKVEGVLYFEYRAYGQVPPGVPPDAMQGSVIASVAWAGTLLGHLQHQVCIIHQQPPEELVRLQGRGLHLA